jgi:hypothetical protein
MEPSKRRRGNIKLSGDRLSDTLDTVISSKGSAELAILYLFSQYDIDLNDLRRILLRLYSSLYTLQ